MSEITYFSADRIVISADVLRNSCRSKNPHVFVEELKHPHKVTIWSEFRNKNCTKNSRSNGKRGTEPWS